MNYSVKVRYCNFPIHYTQLSQKHKSTSFFRGTLKIYSLIFTLFGISLPGLQAAPQGPVMFTPLESATMVDPDTAELVHFDDDDNVYFDIYAIRGQENKIMYAKNGALIVAVQVPEKIQNTFEKELWLYITSLLGVSLVDVEILMFPFEACRRVILKKGKLTVDECQAKIKDVLKPYIPLASQTPGQTEPPPMLSPYDPLAVYAHNDTNMKQAPLKYYEVTLPKEETPEKMPEKIPRKKLVEMKPFYNKDPSWMAKILRDLRFDKDIVLRGRLIPGMPLRPVIDDYRGPKKVKLRRTILQGIADGSGIPQPKSKVRFEMSHPVPAAIMLDYLSPDKAVVVSRRVISPLFRNDTVDFVEEFEYTEVL